MKDPIIRALVEAKAADIENVNTRHKLNMAIAGAIEDPTYCDSDVPDFVGSIDAAAKLVPEGMCFDVAGYPVSGQAWVGPRDDAARSFIVAATPALALSAAALRKRGTA